MRIVTMVAPTTICALPGHDSGEKSRTGVTAAPRLLKSKGRTRRETPPGHERGVVSSMATEMSERHQQEVDDSRVLYQEDVVTSPILRRILAAGRIIIGFNFVWPFFDKVFGLGYATPAERAWIDGGAPAQGFIQSLEGPTAGFFQSISGPWADWLFMIGLLGIGVAMMAGAGLKIAAWSGTLLLIFMWVALIPIGQANLGFTNPIIDSHWIEALVLLAAAYGLAGDTWGVGRWWGGIVGNGWLR